MTDIYYIADHTIDFTNNYAKVDGVLLGKKELLVNFFMSLLTEVGYSFEPVVRPLPAILRNWRSIDYRYIRKWIILCLKQLVVTPKELYLYCVLDLDGFSLYDKRSEKFYRLVHIKLSADGYKYDATVTFDNVASIINRFFASDMSNKFCLIE